MTTEEYFICDNCGFVRLRSRTVFDQNTVCPQCGTNLREVIFLQLDNYDEMTQLQMMKDSKDVLDQKMAEIEDLKQRIESLSNDIETVRIHVGHYA